MSDPVVSTPVVSTSLQLVRLPVDKPHLAVEFLRHRSGGVMDLIAHFWERLSHTPPLLRQDLHLVIALPVSSTDEHINITKLESAAFSGAMLYVPKAHRADVLALDPNAAAAFVSYIHHQGMKILKAENPPDSAPESSANRADGTPKSREEGGVARDAPGQTGGSGRATPGETGGSSGVFSAQNIPFTDLSAPIRTGTAPEPTLLPLDLTPDKSPTNNHKLPIDFLTGEAETIAWMTPLLLPLVSRRTPARQLVNAVMQLPPHIPTPSDAHVRLAKEADIPTLNRWRRQYKEERGILFDADMDAWIQNQRIFVYETQPESPAEDSEGQGPQAVPAVVSVAKIDLDLPSLVEIGGVYTFPEYRTKGYGDSLVKDIAHRIRQAGKMPTLQVDELNTPALSLYQKAGWHMMGKLARVWLSAS